MAYLYVCQTTTFESLDVGSSYLHMRYISTVYGSSSYIDHRVKVKVTGAKKVEYSYARKNNSIGNNSRSIKHGAVMFARSMGFPGTADQMM